MICPKCGFSQPDDIYCASCGVNVDKYVQKRKKKRFKVTIIVVLIGIAAISIAKFVTEDKEPFEIGRKGAVTEDKVTARRSPQEPLQSQGAEPGEARYPRERKMARLPQMGSPQEVRQPAPTGQDLNRNREILERSATEGREPGTEPPGDQKETVLSAREWFEKGRSLDNDSDAEIQYYQKAIEQDPKFAPAYYRLGAIYFRQANYEQAEKEFILFLQHASEAERLAYNLDLYFSSDYLERLLEEQTAAQSTPEEAEEELAPETELAEEEIPEESLEAIGEVETIIRFSTANGQMLVPVLLNGSVNASLLFDTGAQITVLSRELAQSLDIDERAGRTINLKTIASNIRGQVVTLDSILVGSSSRTDFPVAVVDLSPNQKILFEGILGMDFLGNYAIRIDNQTRNIFLTPKRTTTPHR